MATLRERENAALQGLIGIAIIAVAAASLVGIAYVMSLVFAWIL